ncbi:hypothetical protein TrRE_jg5524, partial [Triparma retinervis]
MQDPSNSEVTGFWQPSVETSPFTLFPPYPDSEGSGASNSELDPAPVGGVEGGGNEGLNGRNEGLYGVGEDIGESSVGIDRPDEAKNVGATNEPSEGAKGGRNEPRNSVESTVEQYVDSVDSDNDTMDHFRSSLMSENAQLRGMLEDAKVIISSLKEKVNRRGDRGGDRGGEG